jgi:hypothetical protein
MSANVDAMVRAGAEAYRNGNKGDARTLLEKAIELDQYNEQAWLWLSAVVDTPEEQRTCLENVLVINPNNERALMGLRSLGIDPGIPQKPATPTPDTSTDDNQSVSPFDFGDDADDLFADNPKPAGGDDIIATSSASSQYRGDTYSNEDYDDWMSNLNIGQTGQSAPASGTSASGASASGASASGGDAFGGDAFGGDAFGGDAFGGDAFGGDAFGDQTTYDEDTFDSGGGAFGDDAFTSDDFGGDAFTTGAGGAFTDDIASADDVNVGFDASFAEDLVDDDEYEAYDEFETAVQEEIFSDDDVFASEGDFYIPDDDDDDAQASDEDFFQYIPKEIDMTRLPGEDEDRPTVLIAVAVLLVVMNLGAVGMLVTSLTG